MGLREGAVICLEVHIIRMASLVPTVVLAAQVMYCGFHSGF